MSLGEREKKKRNLLGDIPIPSKGEESHIKERG